MQEMLLPQALVALGLVGLQSNTYRDKIARLDNEWADVKLDIWSGLCLRLDASSIPSGFDVVICVY